MRDDGRLKLRVGIIASGREEGMISSLAATGIRTVVDQSGPQAFGLFSCSKATNEMNYMAQKFARTVVGSNNIDSCNRT